MNSWVQRSIELAERRDYLDRVAEIYGVGQQLRRPLKAEDYQELRRLWEAHDWRGVLTLLLRLHKFPYQEPLVGFFRVDPTGIDRNPKSAARIIRVLNTMGLDNVVQGIEEPPQVNRLLASNLKKWLRTLPYDRLDRPRFMQAPGIACLQGSNGELLDFANSQLKCALAKRPDFVAKTRGGYVVAEAKFITVPGGNQDKSFREVMQFVQSTEGEASRVGIVDGAVWVKKTGLYATIRGIEKIALSALLLKEFLDWHDSQ
jgi:hypothetical protein